jgi:hypothetical protein
VIIEALADKRRTECGAVEVVNFHGLQNTTFAIRADLDDEAAYHEPAVGIPAAN